MGGIRLRTKFLLSMVVVSAALTFTTLLVVRHTVQQEVRLERFLLTGEFFIHRNVVRSSTFDLQLIREVTSVGLKSK